MECLSLMMGNYLVGFLGGLELVTAPGYPTYARPSEFFGHTRFWGAQPVQKIIENNMNTCML